MTITAFHSVLLHLEAAAAAARSSTLVACSVSSHLQVSQHNHNYHGTRHPVSGSDSATLGNVNGSTTEHSTGNQGW